MTELESINREIEALKDKTDRLDDELQLQIGKLEELYRIRFDILCKQDETLPQCKMYYSNGPLAEGYAFVITNPPGEGKLILRQVGSPLVYPIDFLWNDVRSRYEPKYDQVITNNIHLRDVPKEFLPQNFA